MTPPRAIAFSLLELVLVLVVIAIAVAVVTPSLGGWSRGMRLRSATDTLLAATRFARDRAVTDAAAQRLTIDPTSGQVTVVADVSFNTGIEEEPRTFRLPQGVTIAVESDQGQPLEAILFQPDGRMEAAVLRLTTPQGDVLTLASDTPAKGFVVQETGGAR